MRTTNCRVIVLSMLSLPVFCQPPVPVRPAKASSGQGSYTYQILYTGRTLGYARVPDEQTLPQSPDQTPNGVAQEFLDQFALATSDQVPQFRLAMGDNFSPDLFGRSIRVKAPLQAQGCDADPNLFYSREIHLPKEIFNFQYGVGWTIWCHPGQVVSPEPFFDNVADYLRRARYAAVVPGKHDFYFGPQYLQQIADYLGNSDEHVHMLGENLIVSSTVAPGPMNAHPRIPDRLADPCHFNTGKDHECFHTDFGPASLDLPDSVLPWKRQFILHGARRAAVHDPKSANPILFRQDELKNFTDQAVDYTKVFRYTNPRTAQDPKSESVAICVEPGPATNGDPAKALVGDPCAHRMPLIASEDACTENPPAHLKSTCKAIYPDTEGVYTPKKQPAGTDITFLFANPGDHLIAGLNHMFCVVPSDAFAATFKGDQTKICQPFPVQAPMFWSNPNNGQPNPGMANCDERKSVPCPYALVPEKKDAGMQVAIFGVVDPDLLSNVGMLNASWLNSNPAWDTAAQVTAPDYALLQTLELCNASEKCRQAPKILMAQMSYARAKQLISNSNFSGVFDVVVTQASAEHDTGRIEARYQGKTPRFALTPPVPITNDSITDARIQNAVLNDGRQLSMSVFTPQVYVATIHKEGLPRIDPKDPKAERVTAAGQVCGDFALPSPATTYTPPQVSSLPSPPDYHDFGPCWTLKNDSARWSTAAVATAGLKKDVAKLARPQRPFCAAPAVAGGLCQDLRHLAELYLGNRNGSAQAQLITNAAASDPLAQAVLFAMRNDYKTDAAMIQSRDLYDADNLSMEQIQPSELQDQISRVVWKGDEVVVLHVTGATVRKLLKQSATFAQLDKNALNTEVETGRDLVTLGIYPDPKDSNTYYINGAAMSDTALYSIATTDFISAGDTGYSNLATPDVLPTYRVRDFARKEVRPLAGLVCKHLAPYLTPAPGGPDLPCADMRLGEQYFDTTAQQPNDSTPGLSTDQRWKGIWRTFLPPRRPFPNSEEYVQQHPFWTLKLENLDFSESGAFIKHFTRTVPSLYGVSNPLINKNNTQSLGADYKARAIYDYQKGTNYILSDMTFSYSNTVSYTPATLSVTNGPPALTYNVVGFEGGGTVRLSRNKNVTGVTPRSTPILSRPSWLSFQYALRYEMELVDPVNTEVALTPPPNPQPGTQYVSNLTLKTPAINTIYGRLGLRAEDGDNYAEAGFEEIDSRNLLQSYTLAQPGGPTFYCFPGAGIAIGCGTNNNAGNPNPGSVALMPSALNIVGPAKLVVMPGVASYLTPGAYFNFYWKIPLWSRQDANRTDQSWYFTLTNKGDFYKRTASDTPTQTRYLDKFTPALSFPIWAGLSLTPKVDFIFYENKVNGFHYLAAQPSATLSYTFTRREGMSWRRALRYGAQTTTSSTAGTPH